MRGNVRQVSKFGSAPILLAFVALLAALTILALPAATPAAARPAKRLVLSPRPGQVVRSNVAPLRISQAKGSKVLSARLNGKEIGRWLGRPRHGVRSLAASLSYGLRPGRNVLRVTVRRKGGAVRTAAVTFQVRRASGLVGAGRDQTLDVDGRFELQGTTVPGVGADCGGSSWSVVQAPRVLPGPEAGGARRFTLESPVGLSAGFDPRVPGTYVLRLTTGTGACATSDLESVKVLERSRLVTFESMTAATGDQRGIRVGAVPYKLKDAEGSGEQIQLLVLKRETLEPVANRRYGPDAKGLGEYLRTLQSGVDLAIVVLQPGTGGQVSGLEDALKTIGAPTGKLPTAPGSMSLIGVPGMKAGEAKFNLLDGDRHGSMTGYLTPDQWGNYGFVSSTRVPFNFGPKEAADCDDCKGAVGFRLHVFDPRTGAPAARNGEIFETGNQTPGFPNGGEAINLAEVLRHIPQGDIVMLETVSAKEGSGSGYLPPVGRMPSPALAKLAAAVAGVGGTRDAFNRVALKSGAAGSRGLTYALVGWQGAGGGAGVQAAAGVENEGEEVELDGVLRPNNESLLRPEEGDSTPDALTEVVMKKPTAKWPLEDKPAAMRALAWLGEQNKKLSADPRADYVRQPFKGTEWDEIAGSIKSVEFSQVPPTRRAFTKKNFLEAREELFTELKWVGTVRSYLENLAKPIAGREILSYAEVKKIAAKVYKESQEPKDETTMRWLEFTQIMLELAGPFTHEVSGTVASVMSLGIWMFGSTEEGGEADEISFEGDELGDKIVEQMDASVKAYGRMGDVIVSDPAKLKFVGENGGCSPENKACPPGWSFTKEDEATLEADLERSVEREAWQELLPLGFKVYGTNEQKLRRPPDLRQYYCQVYHPFSEFSQTAENLSVYPLLWEADSNEGFENVWKPLVLAKPRGNSTLHASTLSDATLERVFGPVSASKSPHEGGLGVSLARLVPEKNWAFWQGVPFYHPTRDACE